LTDSFLFANLTERGKNMLCKRTVKNQITLPKKIMDKFDECEYFEVKAEVDRIILIPVKLVSLKENPLTAVRQKIFSLGLSERDISDAIKWARSRK
jgi:hypothetical protein